MQDYVALYLREHLQADVTIEVHSLVSKGAEYNTRLIFITSNGSLAFALLAQESGSLVYIEKIDTTECRVPGLARHATRAYVSCCRTVRIFARSMPQYLFPKSAESAKPLKSGSQLVNWWVDTLDCHLEKHIFVPGETESFKPKSWKWGLAKPLDAIAVEVLPQFEDDVKTKVLQNYIDKTATVAQVMEVLGVVSEFGDTGALFTIINQAEIPDKNESFVEQLAFSEFLKFWMSKDFDSKQNILQSTTEIIEKAGKIGSFTSVVLDKADTMDKPFEAAKKRIVPEVFNVQNLIKKQKR